MLGRLSDSMEVSEIVDKVEYGEFTKDELVSIAEACAHAINDRNHEEKPHETP